MQERFNEHFKIAAHIQLIVPRNVASTRFADIEQTVNFYNRDIDCEAMGDEFARWKKKWERIPERERPGSAIDTLAAIETQKDFYPNIYTILEILATLLVTTASAERIFSCLRRLKNYLRGSMGQERLSGLAFTQIHRSQIPNPEMVLNELAKSSRKLNLLL